MEDLKAFLEGKFAALEQGLDRVEQRLEEEVSGLRPTIVSLEQKLEQEARQLRVLIEAAERDIRLVADGHRWLYEGMERRQEEIRNDMREVRGLLNIWNELVSRRLTDLEHRLPTIAG